MSRISNSKKYNDMCNHYESIISQLEYELSMLQQAYNEVVENYMDLVAVVNSLDVLSRLEQQEDKVSQIETGKDSINDDRKKIRKKRLEKNLKHLFSYVLVSVITFFLTCIWRNHISQGKLVDICSEDDEPEDEEDEEDDIELSEDDVEQLLEHDFPNWDYETVGDENCHKKRRLEL